MIFSISQNLTLAIGGEKRQNALPIIKRSVEMRRGSLKGSSVTTPPTKASSFEKTVALKPEFRKPQFSIANLS